MNKKSLIKKLALSALALVVSILFIVFFPNDYAWYIKWSGYILTVGLGGIAYYGLIDRRERLYRICFILQIVWLVIVACIALIAAFDLVNILSNIENVKNIILSTGNWGIVVCLVLQIVQVVILPVPATIFYIAISAIYGLIGGFFICYIGTLIGSLIAFCIGKLFGKKAVEWCVGKDKVEKYSDLLNRKGKVPFILMQLLPFFPDDILCMIAGLSSMSYRYFTLVMIFSKPLYIFLVCLLGTGDIIPLNGWGIAFYVVIFGGFILISWLYFKYQDKIDKFFLSKFSKNKKNNPDNVGEDQ